MKAATKKATKATTKAKAAKATTNPESVYRADGGYHNAVRALRGLGVNKMHSHDAILPAVKKAYGADGWKAFAAKAKGGKLTADERAMLNVAVTARKDYGKPLHEIGYEVRWDGREKTAGLFKVGHK